MLRQIGSFYLELGRSSETLCFFLWGFAGWVCDRDRSTGLSLIKTMRKALGLLGKNLFLLGGKEGSDEELAGTASSDTLNYRIGLDWGRTEKE